MICTEAVAGNKWCPLAQLGYQMYSNRGTSEIMTCSASNCMMWREAGRIVDENNFGNYIPTGYCGLAGKP